MRYYEIAQRPKPQTATDRITRGERHLEHDAGQISPSGRGLRMSGDAAKAKPYSAGTGSCHAPVPHPGRYGRVQYNPQAWGFMGEALQSNRAGAAAPAHRLYPHREGR